MNEMFRMVKTEIWKLKRYHVIWAGVFLMLLSVLLTLFSTTAMDGSSTNSSVNPSATAATAAAQINIIFLFFLLNAI